jgi:hypothetical protein
MRLFMGFFPLLNCFEIRQSITENWFGLHSLSLAGRLDATLSFLCSNIDFSCCVREDPGQMFRVLAGCAMLIV